MAAKPASERVRPRLGDVIEIETPEGFAYAQYTHKHTDPPRLGELLRILPGLYPERPSDFAPLVTAQERFSVFFPLGPALNRGIFRIVSNELIPDDKKSFPRFRRRVVSEGEVGPWWIWDGTKSWPAKRRDTWTPRAIGAVWNDRLLVERIASGWTPDDDPALSDG